MIYFHFFILHLLGYYLPAQAGVIELLGYFYANRWRNIKKSKDREEAHF